jgi:hypothetical protein
MSMLWMGRMGRPVGFCAGLQKPVDCDINTDTDSEVLRCSSQGRKHVSRPVV